MTAPLGKFSFSAAYTSKADPGGNPYTLNPVGYTPSHSAETHPSFGKYTRFQVALDIPQDVLTAAGVTPIVGDSFVGEDGNTYNVTGVGAVSIFFVRVTGWCPTISLPLADSVTYCQATGASSSTTARTVTETQDGSAINAAIQPMTAALGLQFGTKNFGDSYLIYTATDPSGTGPSVVEAGDLFVDGNGVKYEIEEVLERNRLDFLPAFRCVKKL